MEELQRLCLQSEPLKGLEGLDLARLTPYAVQTRYDFEFWPDREVALATVELAEEVTAIVLSQVPPEAKP